MLLKKSGPVNTSQGTNAWKVSLWQTEWGGGCHNQPEREDLNLRKQISDYP